MLTELIRGFSYVFLNRVWVNTRVKKPILITSCPAQSLGEAAKSRRASQSGVGYDQRTPNAERFTAKRQLGQCACTE